MWLRILLALADVAQLVERHLAKVKAAGSRPVVRSRGGMHRPPAALAAWPSGSGKGLQNPLPRFNSGRRLEGQAVGLADTGA